MTDPIPMPRFDLYHAVHKGLRAALAEALTRLGAAPPGDAAAFATLREALALCRLHAGAEDGHIHAALEARAPGAAAAIAAEHAAHAAEIAALEEAAATVPGDAAAWRRLYAAFARFVARSLEHMAEEEETLTPLLQALLTDAELQAIQGAILAALGPAGVLRFLRPMLPALAPEERVRLMAGLLRGPLLAAEDDRAAALGLVRAVLDSPAAAVLRRALGEAPEGDAVEEPWLLQMDFPFAGPWGEDLVAALAPLAGEIAATPGLIWKIWTENREEGRAGGIYLFAGEAPLRRYLAMHAERLAGFGVREVTARAFRTNAALGAIDRAPLTTAA